MGKRRPEPSLFPQLARLDPWSSTQSFHLWLSNGRDKSYSFFVSPAIVSPAQTSYTTTTTTTTTHSKELLPIPSCFSCLLLGRMPALVLASDPPSHYVDAESRVITSYKFRVSHTAQSSPALTPRAPSTTSSSFSSAAFATTCAVPLGQPRELECSCASVPSRAVQRHHRLLTATPRFRIGHSCRGYSLLKALRPSRTLRCTSQVAPIPRSSRPSRSPPLPPTRAGPLRQRRPSPFERPPPRLVGR